MDFGEFGVVTNSYRYADDHGPADFDQTHIFTVNYIYDIPGLSRHWDNRLVRAVFDNCEDDFAQLRIGHLDHELRYRARGVIFARVAGAL